MLYTVRLRVCPGWRLGEASSDRGFAGPSVSPKEHRHRNIVSRFASCGSSVARPSLAKTRLWLLRTLNKRCGCYSSFDWALGFLSVCAVSYASRKCEVMAASAHNLIALLRVEPWTKRIDLRQPLTSRLFTASECTWDMLILSGMWANR